MKRPLETLLVGFSACLVFLAGCYTVPETGRSSLNLMPESVLQQQASAAFDQMQDQAKVSSDPQKIARVERIGTRVLRAAGPTGDLPPPEDWEFVVFEDDETINAFAMPGGKVGVYTGLMNLAQTDDQLAAVIGHEIAHVSARHGNERMSQALIRAGGAVALGYAVKDEDEKTQQAVMLAYGVGTQVGGMLPFSRLHENEADKIGLMYMARAGYDPRAAVQFWQRMEDKSGGKAPPELLSTHPSHGTRIERLREQLPEAMEAYRQAGGQ